MPALADRRTPSAWPAPVLESLQEAITESDLVDAVSAEHDAGRRREMLVEALYYTGQSRLAEGLSVEAVRYFEAAAKLRVLYFIEHHLAEAELARLRHRSE
jgi:lipoprotein NlpI